MTIEKYLSGLPEHLKVRVMNRTEIWSANACQGYCLNAMKRVQLDEETQKSVLQALWIALDELTVDEAEHEALQNCLKPK